MICSITRNYILEMTSVVSLRNLKRTAELTDSVQVTFDALHFSYS